MDALAHSPPGTDQQSPDPSPVDRLQAHVRFLLGRIDEIERERDAARAEAAAHNTRIVDLLQEAHRQDVRSLHTAIDHAQKQDAQQDRIDHAQQMARDAQQHLQDCQRSVIVANERAAVAEQRALAAEQRALAAEQCALAANARAAVAEHQALAAIERADEAEDCAALAEDCAAVAEDHAIAAEHRAFAAEHTAETNKPDSDSLFSPLDQWQEWSHAKLDALAMNMASRRIVPLECQERLAALQDEAKIEPDILQAYTFACDIAVLEQQLL